MKVSTRRLLVEFVVFSVWSSSTQAGLPRSCSRDFTIVACNPQYGLSQRQLVNYLKDDVGVDFVFMKPTFRACQCNYIMLARKLRDTDVIVVSTAVCTLRNLVRCDFRAFTPKSTQRTTTKATTTKATTTKATTTTRKIIHESDPRPTFVYYSCSNYQCRERRQWQYEQFYRKLNAWIQRRRKRLGKRSVVVTAALPSQLTVTTIINTTISARTAASSRSLLSGELCVGRGGSRQADVSRNDKVRQVPRRAIKSLEQPDHRILQRGVQCARNCSQSLCEPSATVGQAWEPEHSKLTRRKRAYRVLTSYSPPYPHVVPYRAFAGGEFYSIFDTDAILRALAPRRLTRRRYRRRYREKKKKVTPEERRGDKFVPETEILKLSSDSERRMKSFIIFFVAIIGIITIIAVLLILRMKGQTDKQSPSAAEELRKAATSSDVYHTSYNPFMDQAAQYQYEDQRMYMQEPQFSYYEWDQQPASYMWADQHPPYWQRPRRRYRYAPYPRSLRETCFDGSNPEDECDVNINRQSEESSQSSSQVSFHELGKSEKAGMIMENHRNQVSMKRYRRYCHLQHYKPCLHGNFAVMAKPGSENLSVQDKTDKNSDMSVSHTLHKRQPGNLINTNSSYDSTNDSSNNEQPKRQQQ